MRLRIDLAYDGTDFVGFARQIDQRTVQGELEAALGRLVGCDVATTCAGRTDRGVHARAQVVHCDLGLPDDRFGDNRVFRHRLDRSTPRDITIWGVRHVSNQFDARFSATARTYCYRIVDGLSAADPIKRRDHWFLGERLDHTLMAQAGRYFIGEHDFAAFCRKAPGRTTVRTISRCKVERAGEGLTHITVVGNAFCHQQVRSLVGCLVEVGRSRKPADWVQEVLASKDRAQAARVAPPHGLTLEHVTFGRGWPAAPAVEK